MNISEARKIVIGVEDAEGKPRMDNLAHEGSIYWESKRFIEGWEARGLADGEIAGNSSRYSLPGMTSLEVSEEIAEEILKLDKEAK